MLTDCTTIVKLFKENFNKTISIYEESYKAINNVALIMAIVDEKDMLIVCAKEDSIFNELIGDQKGIVKLCELNHKNRLIINRCLPFTKPTALGSNSATLGLGDRLGNANYAHLKALKGSGIKPVLAQQSIRELSLTGRTYDDVLDAASWAVFKSGWTEGFAADGDHLKEEADIMMALNCGYTMITLDCSNMMAVPPDNFEELTAAYNLIPIEKRKRFEKEYLNSKPDKLQNIEYTMDGLMKITVEYNAAIDFTIKIFNDYISKAGYPVDFELSLDETGHTTSLGAHYFVASELKRANISINSLAPCFVGEFQKGIDYIGDPKEFSVDLYNHSLIAQHFGYKLSIHSGSDKFSIFEFISEKTLGKFHVKTSGTTWLEAVRVIAQKEPDLYRQMHTNALEHFEKAKKIYHVSADVSKVIPLEQTKDEDLPKYLQQDDSRQLLHITYGFMLAEKDLKDRIFKALDINKNSFENNITTHIGKHVNLLK